MVEARREVESELERVEDPGVETTPEEAHPAELLRDKILHQLDLLRSHHSRAIENGDVEAIHKMRVITRRLQAAIDLLQNDANEIRIISLKRQLRTLRRSLAILRNYDVFIGMIETESSRRPSLQRQQNELITTEMRRRRERSLVKIRKSLSSSHLDELAHKIRALWAHWYQTDLTARSLKSAGQPGFGIDRFAGRVVDRLEQRYAELQHLASQVQAISSGAEVHQLRIAAKRLRYLLELVSEIGYGDAKRSTEWLKVLQDRLGDLHDVDAFEEEVLDLVARRKFMKDHMMESGGMLCAAARIVGRKDVLSTKTFPVRVPLSVGAAARRLARAASRKSRLQSIQRVPKPWPVQAAAQSKPIEESEALTAKSQTV